MPRGDSFIIDPREVLERKQHRLDLPTENIFLSFIDENNDKPGWEGLKNKWERERERGVLPIFEKQTMNLVDEGHAQELEQVRAFINYLDERHTTEEKEKQTNEVIRTRAEEIRGYITTYRINDREMANEITTEFNEDLNIFILSNGNAVEPLLKRMEEFIEYCNYRLPELRSTNATRLWHLQLSARAIRNELLRRHFVSPETH